MRDLMQVDHHRMAIASLARKVADEGAFDALIVTGSVPRGTAGPDSDIDCYVVVSSEEYEHRKAAGALAWFAECDYPGGYVDGKVVSLALLEAAAERGSEPTRSSFASADVAYSRIGDLAPLMSKIASYPEANRAENMRDFYAAACLHAAYFGPHALKKGDLFLLTHAAAMAALFGVRALLAHNRVLFPCPKQLLAALDAASEQPPGFAENLRDLLRAPSEGRFATHHSLLDDFTDWGISGLAVLSRFMELDEWRWQQGEPELAQR